MLNLQRERLESFLGPQIARMTLQTMGTEIHLLSDRQVAYATDDSATI